jgi:hypothetical protein
MGPTFRNCDFQPVLVKSKLTEVAEYRTEVTVYREYIHIYVYKTLFASFHVEKHLCVQNIFIYVPDRF